MDIIRQAGIRKRSFELDHNGGKIWCEHLDGMGSCEDEVITKFLGDIIVFSRPSVSSFMIINLDKTVITAQIADTIINGIANTGKAVRKIAFVGVDKRWQRSFGELRKNGTAIIFLSDYEKAKEWLFA